jgi:hypothetical protein
MASVDREVAGLFNDAQRSAAATERSAKHFWRVAGKHPEQAGAALERCVDLVLAAAQVRRVSARAARCGMLRPCQGRAPQPHRSS